MLAITSDRWKLFWVFSSGDENTEREQRKEAERKAKTRDKGEKGEARSTCGGLLAMHSRELCNVKMLQKQAVLRT